MNTFRWVPESKHRARTRAPDRVVMHSTEGSFAGAVAWFLSTDNNVAAHYVVSVRGDICQMVADDRKCNHAGSRTEAGWNDRSIGIELEDRAHDRIAPGELQLRAAAKVARAMCLKFDIPMDREHIIGHSEVPGATHTDPGPLFPWDRFLSYVRLAD